MKRSSECLIYYIITAEDKLRKDVILDQRTTLPVENLIELLTFCLNTTSFLYDGTYYQQVFGTAMGSPVSVVIANHLHLFTKFDVDIFNYRPNPIDLLSHDLFSGINRLDKVWF